MNDKIYYLNLITGSLKSTKPRSAKNFREIKILGYEYYNKQPTVDFKYKSWKIIIENVLPIYSNNTYPKVLYISIPDELIDEIKINQVINALNQ